MIIKKILIIGYGSIGKRHFNIAKNLFPDTKIGILRHINTEPAKIDSKDIYFDLNKALLFNPDLVVISNPATEHLSVANAFTEIGSNMLIEKPLSDSLSGVSEFIKLIKVKKNIVLIGNNLRFSKSLQNFKKAIHNREIGRIISVRCEVGQYLPSWRSNSNYRMTVSAKKKLGGGVLLELSHEIDYLKWIFGDIKWVSAVLSRQSSLDIDVEDTAHITMGFDFNGDTSQLIGTLNLDFIRQDKTRYCIAIGEDSSLRWDGVLGQMQRYDIKNSKWISTSNKEDLSSSYLNEWIYLKEMIQKKDDSLGSVLEAESVLKVIEAIRLSSSTFKRVEL